MLNNYQHTLLHIYKCRERKRQGENDLTTGICQSFSVENYSKTLNNNMLDYFSLFSFYTLLIRHMNYFDNVNVHDAFYF